jgi:hypothetical protein
MTVLAAKAKDARAAVKGTPEPILYRVLTPSMPN